MTVGNAAPSGEARTAEPARVVTKHLFHGTWRGRRRPPMARRVFRAQHRGIVVECWARRRMASKSGRDEADSPATEQASQ